MSDCGQALREGIEHALKDQLDSTWWANRDEQAFDAKLWAQIEELGLFQLFTGDENATSLEEAHGAVQALASLSVPLPAADTLMAHWLASQVGLSVPEGPVVLAPTGVESKPAITGTLQEPLLSGNVHNVPWGGTATLLLEAKRDEDTVWCVVNPEHCSPDNRKGLHGEPRPHLKFHALGLDPSAVAKAPNDTLALNAGAALRAVEMASALSRAMDMCVEYTRERVQFGRPLAKFQAIQQQLAVLASLSAQARVAARRAFVALESGSSDFVVANAKSAVGQAASQGAAIAHQSHGAMGFTAEYGLHRLTRRIWTWREDFGNELYWSTQVGKHVANVGADGLWGLLAEEP